MTDSPELTATLSRLQDQINWYDTKSRHNQRAYKWSSAIEIIVAVLIPIAAWLLPNVYPALMGAAVAVLRGLSNLNQWEFNWTSYRSTAEKLKHEQHLYFARSGPYGEVENAQRLLSERTEATISREHAAWITLTERSGKKSDAKGEVQ